MATASSVTRSTPATARIDRIASCTLSIQTPRAGFFDITRDVAAFLAEVRGGDGALTLFVRHTSASLTIQENADPSVLVDLMTSLDRLAPQDFAWTHDTEGPDDMPAHIRTMLTATSLHVPVLAGRMALGTWQGIYLVEHRARPHRREVVLQFVGAARA